MKHVLFAIFISFLSITTLTCQNNLKKPNIVFILIDDLGWADLGFMGNSIYDTPNLDQLASEGIFFNQAYAPAANCAPSRACIMSGRNTPFHGIYTVGSSERGKAKDRKLVPVKNKTVLQDSVETIADFLKAQGYATASIGKWHLGDSPLSQGFDINIGGSKVGHPKSYFSPYKNPTLADGPDGEHLTDRLTDEALAFVSEQKDRPFFLYLPHFTVHTPLQGKEELVQKYKERIGSDVRYNAKYGAMVENMDMNVGRLIDGLNDMDVAENTLIIFLSDNGGLTSISRQTPLRAGKGSYYEGGIRVPMVIKWPGMIKAGQASELAVTGLDIFPTIMDLVVSGSIRKDFDGLSLREVMLNEGEIAERSLFWHFPIYLQAYNPQTDDGRDPLFRTRPGMVIRKGDWKLHVYFENGEIELYDLSEDIGERKNVAVKYPQKARELYAEIDKWRSENNALMPTELNAKYEKE